MKANKHFKTVSRIMFAVLIPMILLGFLFALHKSKKNATKITVAVPYNEYVQNFDTNYYSNWLREKSGYDIEFVTISDGYEEEYLSTMLRAEEGRVDAVLLPGEKHYVNRDTIVTFAKEGLIEDLTDRAVRGTQIRRVLDEAQGIESLNKDFDGRLFFVPRIDAGKKQSNMQVLWINIGWLKKLSLQVPETTEDLVKVLTAFRDMDPNQNGKHDEIPLISNNKDDPFRSYYFLLNAFSYVDPTNGYIIESKEEDFENGLKYCRNLYEEGLLSGSCNEYSLNQVRELVNAPDDLVGAFTSKSIDDVVYPNCEDVLVRFIQVPPLKGPNGEQNAIALENEGFIGGFIPANAKHKEEAFNLMEIMLSLDGSLISCFGEEDTDWRTAANGELSGYGTKARITTLEYLTGKIQNKNYMGTGPMYLPKDYSDAVSWNGGNNIVEYLDARAVRTYEQFFRSEKQSDGSIDNIDLKIGIQEAKDLEAYIFSDNRK